MSEAEEMCECGTEVDQIHCQVCGRKVCSLHDYNATIDMLQQERDELRRQLGEARRIFKQLLVDRIDTDAWGWFTWGAVAKWLEQNKEDK